MEKVLLGMSGGVDSSTSAYLLKEQGYEVIAVTMILFENQDLSAVDDAKKVCDILSIKHEVVHFEKEFKEHVMNYFIDSYKNGKTPNPCIECNKYIKFGALYDYAKQINANYIATGHYAKEENGSIMFSNSDNKDQSYFLYKIDKDIINHILFPLANYKTKDEVRAIAAANNLPVATKKDSEEICFIKNNDYGSFLEKNMSSLPNQGNFIDLNGNILGKHKGIIYYTIGQRKGLGISFNKPLYVISINKENNTITLGDEEYLFKDSLIATDANIFIKEIPDKVYAKVRFRGPLTPAKIKLLDNGDLKVDFESKIRAITPGQSVVFWNKDGVLIGGGVIK